MSHKKEAPQSLWHRLGVETRKRLAYLQQQPTAIRVVGLLLVLLVAIFAIPEEQFEVQVFEPGEIATRDVRADRRLVVEDQQRTAELRAQAREQAGLVFERDPRILPAALGAFHERLDKAREAFTRGDTSEDVIQNFAGLLDLSPATASLFWSRGFAPALGEQVGRCLDRIGAHGIHDPAEHGLQQPFTRAWITQGPADSLRRIGPANRPLSIAEARAAALSRCDDLALARLSGKLIQPDTFLDPQATRELADRRAAAVDPVTSVFQYGQIVVREGEEVSELQYRQLQQLSSERSLAEYSLSAIGTLTLAIGLILIPWRYFGHARKKIFYDPDRMGTFFSILLGSVILMKAGLMLIAGFHLGTLSTLNILIYALPVVSGAALIAILLDLHIAMVYSTIFAIICGLMTGQDIHFSIYVFIASLVAAFSSFSFRNRLDLLRAGFWSSLAGSAIVMGTFLVQGSIWELESLWAILFIFLGGQLAMIVAAGFLPLFESLFGMTSDLRLLELSNLGHPLLKQLVIRAPGTYHHSIIVGSLVEAAAERIGVNPLLARVGAYYHDIGKMKKSEYFVENQRDSFNRHDTLTPSMSSLVILNHIKYGMELAEEYNLPRAITDVIQQHHGKTLIRYFYQKALENGESVKEENFRYAGPKPQTRAAALVMLADGAEAACRSIAEPTHNRIQARVLKILNNVFVDGQLDECDLTLKDLSAIAESFTTVLTGIYHHRIEYPEERKPEKSQDRSAQVSTPPPDINVPKPAPPENYPTQNPAPARNTGIQQHQELIPGEDKGEYF